MNINRMREYYAPETVRNIAASESVVIIKENEDIKQIKANSAAVYRTYNMTALCKARIEL